MAWLQNWDVWLAVFGLLVQFGLAYLGMSLAKELHWKHKLAFYSLLAVGVVIAVFAVVRGGEMSASVEQSLTTMTQDINKNRPRAVVDFDHVGMKLKGTTLFANVYVKNTSPDEPAQKVDCSSAIWVVPAENGVPSKETQGRYYNLFEKKFVRPLQQSFSPIRASLDPGKEIWGTDTLRPFNGKSVRWIDSGREVVLLTGVVFYSDRDGDHRKDFCQWLQRPFPVRPGSRAVAHYCNGHNALRY